MNIAILNNTLRSPNFTYFILLVAATMIFASCKKESSSPSPSTTSQPVNGGGTTSRGSADITLTAGTATFKLIGGCSFEPAFALKYVNAYDANVSNRDFYLYFHSTVKAPPLVTTTYKLTELNNLNDPNSVAISFGELVNDKSTGWKSTSTSGSLTLKVEGEKITAELSGISLAPAPSNIFDNGNVGEFAKDGKLTGTITFYR